MYFDCEGMSRWEGSSMSKIETQNQRAPQGSTWQTTDMVTDCGNKGADQAGCSPAVAHPIDATTLERGKVAPWSSCSSTPSVGHQNRAYSIQKPHSNSGITVDNAEQVMRSLDLLGFRQKIWTNSRPSELAVGERWVDTAQGPRHVIYLSDTC